MQFIRFSDDLTDVAPPSSGGKIAPVAICGTLDLSPFIGI